MSNLIDLIHKLVGKLIDLVILPASKISPVFGLILISLIFGVVFSYLYGKITPQKSIKKIKKKISAQLMEIYLYRHELVVSLRAQVGLFISGIKYFLLAVPAIIALIVPCIFILSQLNLYYGSRPIKVNESVIVRAKVENSDDLTKLFIKTSSDADITGPVRVKSLKEIFWKITPKKESNLNFDLSLEGSNSTYTKSIKLSNDHSVISTSEFKDWFMRLLYPSRDMQMPKALRIKELVIQYPTEDLSLFGLKWNWLVLFFILSLVSGYAASKVFKIEI